MGVHNLGVICQRWASVHCTPNKCHQQYLLLYPSFNFNLNIRSIYYERVINFKLSLIFLFIHNSITPGILTKRRLLKGTRGARSQLTCPKQQSHCNVTKYWFFNCHGEPEIFNEQGENFENRISS